MNKMGSKKLGLGIVLLGVFAAVCVAVLLVTRTTRASVAIDEAEFPDEGMREYVAQKVDTNADGQLSVDEAAKITTIDISGVSDLSGLDRFPNLKIVRGSDQTLKSADLAGCSALAEVNFSGATNLTDLKLGGNRSLWKLCLRNTGVTQVDLKGVDGLDVLQCDTDVEVANAPKRKVNLVQNYKVTTTSVEGASTTTVDATYDEEGRLTQRTIKGGVNAQIDYTYDELGRPIKVVVDSPEDIANVWTIGYGENGLDLHAVGQNGTYIDKTFDELGREAGLSVRANGITGVIDERITYGYGPDGMLSSVTVTPADGQETTFALAYNTQGRMTSMASPDEAYTFDANGSNTVDYAPAPLTERRGDTTVVRDFRSGQYYKHPTAGIYEQTLGADGSVLSRSSGAYTYDDKGALIYGNVSMDDGSMTRSFNVKSKQEEVSLDVHQESPSAVNFRYLTDPDITVDYWLMDTPEWLLNQEVMGITVAQDMTKRPVWNSTNYDDEKWNSTEDLYSDSLQQLVNGENYAFADIDGDLSAELIVSASGNSGDVSAIYTLTGEAPTLCRGVGEGETLSLSGNGYLVAKESDGTVRLEHFNGATFDVLGEGTELVAGYAPVSGLEWQKG